MNDGVADEQKSVARQIENARSYAEAKGWTVVEDYIFIDDGVSGAEFERRPGYMRLRDSLAETRTPFDVLIVSELSRLGREQLEVGYTCKQFSEAGGRIFSYLEDKELRLDSPTDKLMLAVLNYASEQERKDASLRVTDAMIRKAKAGHVTGGRCFGYTNVDVVGPEGKRSHVKREVNQGEAAIVQRIYELYATGSGLTAIAKRLNVEGAESPRPQQNRPRGWSASSIREILHRPLYRGEIVYNKTKKRDTWGKKSQKKADRPDW